MKVEISCSRPGCKKTRWMYESILNAPDQKGVKRFCSRSCRTSYYNSRSESLREARKRHKAPWLTERNKKVNAEQSRRTAVQRSRTLREKFAAKGRPRKSYPKKMGEHEHRQVARKLLGRPLRSDEIVHHINEDITDNRPENLKILTRADHFRLHVRKEVIA